MRKALTKKTGKELYNPPLIIDLTNMSVEGQQVSPTGYCENGSFPTSGRCIGGDTVTQPTQCSPGAGFLAACSPVGNSPDIGACTTGGNVASGCISGGTIMWPE